MMCTLIALVGVVAAPARAGVTTRVSVASDGTQGNGYTNSPSISADGRYVAFRSLASNLVPGDTNVHYDVFVHDRQTGQTTRVSVASDGTQGNAECRHPSISADGRYVAFQSEASNLVPGDTNGQWDVFVHDRLTGETTRVSVASDGTQANDGSYRPCISADGRHVAFLSNASNLVPGDSNDWQDVFVHDRQTGQTTRVSVASDGSQANHQTVGQTMSADGRYVAFYSYASNLVPGGTNGGFNTFVHDRQTGQTTRASLDTSGALQGDDPSFSADGRYLAFRHYYGSRSHDIFVQDRHTGETTQVDVASDGTGGNSGSMYPSISADGRYVAFWSAASNLVPGDSNDVDDIFVHDRLTGETTRVSVATDGSQANLYSVRSSISADGRYVAFHSLANTLVPGDTNECSDIFLRDRWASQCLTVAGNCWHMVTLPCHPTNPDPWEVFDELRPPTTALDSLSGCLYRYDPATMGYVAYYHSAPEEFGSMVAGAGYWLWVFDTVTICYQAECSGGSESVDFATPGWHMMGSAQLVDTHLDATLWYHAAAGPYPFSTVTVPGDTLWLADPLYCWSPSTTSYAPCGLHPEEDDHLRLFRAYWLYTFVDDVTVEVPVP
jgi:Tol biopolymer transport system component